jgi:hypothetical protein
LPRLASLPEAEPPSPDDGSAELLSPDSVWRAVVGVAGALELFDDRSIDGSVDPRRTEALAAAAAAEGWSCAVCGRRFAPQALAAAQACEARHAAASQASQLMDELDESASVAAAAQAAAEWGSSPRRAAATSKWGGSPRASGRRESEEGSPRAQSGRVETSEDARSRARKSTRGGGGGGGGPSCTVQAPLNCSVGGGREQCSVQ